MSESVSIHQPCDKCGSSDARSVYKDHDYCFSCNTYFPRGERDESEFYKDFVPWRGLSRETMEFYGVKTKISLEGEPLELGFVYPNGDVKIRSRKDKDFRWKQPCSSATAGLFGRDKFSAGGSKYVTITEGELDALSIWQSVRGPVVSVQSASTAVRDCGVDRSWLNGFERIYLAFDNDAVGLDAASAVAKLFDYNKVYQVRFTKRKDANEYVMADESAELKNIWWNSKKYLPTSIKSSYEDIDAILSKPSKPGAPYPFPTLNKMTYGIHSGRSVLLTAPEKVGKTSLMHAILNSLLETEDDNIGTIFLEEPPKDFVERVAGLHLKEPIHLPDHQRSKADVIGAYKAVTKRDERLHIYTHFGSDDPGVLLDTIRFLVTARSCRFILLDHLTMACCGLSGEADERRALDYLSTRLEMMLKELDFCLIFVCHVNDNGETRGSRNPGKICDTRIDLSRERESNILKLYIPYNRFCHMCGPAGEIEFDPKTYTMKEVNTLPMEEAA